jgi:hypothetical protein
MKTKTFVHLCAGAMAFAAASSQASAATLFASGDHSFPVYLSTNTSNGNFAKNIVEGSTALIQLSDIFENDTFWEPFYDSQAGYSASTIATGEQITAAALAGVDLFIGAGPDDAYTNAEIAVLADFLAGGGNVLLAGDQQAFVDQNNFINSALQRLGSSMRIVPDNTLGDTAPRVTNNQYTFNAPSLRYDLTSNVSGGTVLYADEVNRRAIIAFETFAETPAAVPEPATWAMMIAGFGLVGGAMRRRNVKVSYA